MKGNILLLSHPMLQRMCEIESVYVECVISVVNHLYQVVGEFRYRASRKNAVKSRTIAKPILENTFSSSKPISFPILDP